jgi:hypothetical protein|tara:strand:+ start:296 stop:460 length:165 start_codon:yes stop_codon:yes gene_type:complete
MSKGYNPTMLRWLGSHSKSELILMVMKLHHLNLEVKAALSDMTWIESEVKGEGE